MLRAAKWSTVLVVSALAVFLVISTSALAQPRPMTNDVFNPIAKGFDLMRAGKYQAAQFEFKKALKMDRYNPFALNNLAALSAHQGHLKEAMAFLTDAGKYAKDYHNKFQQVCFTEGLCTAVKPVKAMGTESVIAKVIAENMAKLKAKMAAHPSPPVPSTPPAMEKVPAQKKGK
jgi:Flp pilus assembly protein TadD